MMVKEKQPALFWDRYATWEEAEAAWERQSQRSARKQSLKRLKHLPKMLPITPKTKKWIEFKGVRHLFVEDEKKHFLRYFLKKPLTYSYRYCRSFLRRPQWKQREGSILFGIESLDAFYAELEREDALFIVGLSYCEKPFECPSGRFSEECISDLNNPVCRQCSIGKAMHAAPRHNTVPMIITTIHQIGCYFLKLRQESPSRPILFAITACDLAHRLFCRWAQILDLKGVGLRFSGRICNTMKAFSLAEKGIKPGLVTLDAPTQLTLFSLLRHRREKKNARDPILSQ